MNNAKIKAYVADNYVGTTPKLHVDMKLIVRKNENISLTVMYDGIEKTCTGEIVTEAQNCPASEEELVKNLKKPVIHVLWWKMQKCNLMMVCLCLSAGLRN
nr:DUF3656 domain-containing protein [Eubacterium sp. AF22-9]